MALALPSWAFPTLELVRTYLGLDGTDEDALLEQLVAAAVREAESYTGLQFVRRPVTEVRRGNGQRELVLYRGPVAALESVEVDYSPVDDVELVQGEDAIRRTLGVWPEGSLVRVRYTAGLADSAEAVAYEAPEAVAWVLARTARAYELRVLGLTSAQVTGIGTLDAGGELDYRLLDGLRRVPVA